MDKFSVYQGPDNELCVLSVESRRTLDLQFQCSNIEFLECPLPFVTGKRRTGQAWFFLSAPYPSLLANVGLGRPGFS